MEIKWYDGIDPKISDIKVHLDEGQVTLSFKWPNELESLYIYKKSLLKEEEINWDKPYRKYTKSEYARFGGFVDQNLESAMSLYILCPYIQNSFESYLVRYEEHCNAVEVIAKKIEVRYQINEKKKLFSNRKVVQMNIFCETELPRDYLCYVKKKGNIPVSLEDGMAFKFISDFDAGDNILPEIEVDKDEYVRIYLSDAVPHREVYKVVKSV